MGFCDELRAVSRGIWAREKEHPFVKGMGAGTLAPERFRFYLEQDYLFLIDYAKVFALAASKAPDLETMASFARLCAGTLNEEMALHRSCCAEFGIAPADLEAAQPAQTTLGYTGHLLSVAVRGGIADIVAAVLPCQWGYAEIAAHLRGQGLPAEPRYRKWIEMYASPAFEDYGRWLRALLERLAPYLEPAHRERLRTIFHTSSRWEYLFWEMAWRGERWAVPED
jgi:thiaminase/transcriptional activator TenA